MGQQTKGDIMGFGIYPKRWEVWKDALVDIVTGITLGKSAYLKMTAKEIVEHFKLCDKKDYGGGGRGKKYWQSITGWPTLTQHEYRSFEPASPEVLNILSQMSLDTDRLHACYAMLLKCIVDEKQHRRILSEAWDKSVEKKRAKQKSHKKSISALPAFAPKK
jgi:hypothetical protein